MFSKKDSTAFLQPVLLWTIVASLPTAALPHLPHLPQANV